MFLLKFDLWSRQINSGSACFCRPQDFVSSRPIRQSLTFLSQRRLTSYQNSWWTSFSFSRSGLVLRNMPKRTVYLALNRSDILLRSLWVSTPELSSLLYSAAAEVKTLFFSFELCSRKHHEVSCLRFSSLFLSSCDGSWMISNIS